jgi:hypothetical protein
MAYMSQPLSTGRVATRRVVGLVCGPYVVLPAFAIVTGVGFFTSSSWALWAFRIWVIVTAVLALSILAFCPPLPRLSDRSHLLGRMVWLGRFMVAAVLLCLSAFIGAVAGAQVSVDKSGLHFFGTGALLRSVLLIAVEFGVLVFLGWLVIDLWRLGRSRMNGIDRLMINLLGSRFAPMALTPAARGWLMALSSPALASISFVAVGAIFLAALPPTGLRVG